ncbi:MAG: ABC transporter ATP-binding protein, partial [Fibrobacter sp.]|nr:ABC transporter ATP-binding protein [Fibrobacter sp.]
KLPNCLSCSDLHVSFNLHGTISKAVRGVSFDIEQQRTLGIVGESGCGKSMTALSIMRLIPHPPAQIDKGEIIFENQDLLKLPEKQIRKIRGGRISMIFQDPMTSLNPVFTCGFQIIEAVKQHRSLSNTQITELCHKILLEVGISDPSRTLSSYPHQLSGGMRQRVMIAMALICSPSLLIADEPTTALDVTVQARILDLLLDLQSKKSMSMILITHNLGIVGDIAHDVLVMYAGEIMEFATTEKLFESPAHPYTKNLLQTIPHIDKKSDRLTVIPGEVPTIQNIPPGCPFHPRCSYASTRCRKEHPDLYTSENGNKVRCFLYEK